MFSLRTAILAFWLTVGIAHGQGCVATGPCSCKLVDQQVIDLSTVGSKSGPLFKDTKPSTPGDTAIYSYNPCFGFDQGSCKQASCCQTKGTLTAVCGKSDEASVTFNYEDISKSLIISYDGADGGTAHVNVICNMSYENPKLVTLGEIYAKNYFFELTSKCACPGACAARQEGGHTISTGSYLLIGFLIAVVVYFLAGLVVMRIRLGANGSQMIPNRNFWMMLPQNVKEGFLFVFCSFQKSSRDRGYNSV